MAHLNRSAKEMSLTRHCLILLALAVTLTVIQYAGAVWSLADFHPGSDVQVPTHLKEIARIGSVISAPFLVPVVWLTTKIGDSGFIGVVRWILLPVTYAAILYLPLLWLATKRRADPAAPAQRP